MIPGIDIEELASAESTAFFPKTRYLASVLLDTLSIYGYRADVRAARTRAMRRDRDNYIDRLALPVAARQEQRRAIVIRRRMLARRKAVQNVATATTR